MVNENIQANEQNEIALSPRQLAPYAADDLWPQLNGVRVSNAHLAKNRVISAQRKNPAHVAIDMLRTRLLQVLKDKGWKRVAITSPTLGCGKTFIASNLAISMARGESRRVVLMDMDLRKPEIASVFGIQNAPNLREYLSGLSLPEEFFVKVGQNLALGLNSTPESSSAELMLESTTGDVLREMQELFEPDVVLFDLPPVLTHDDVVAFLPQVDGVLLVVGGGTTKAEEVRAVERILNGETPLIATILNKAEGV